MPIWPFISVASLALATAIGIGWITTEAVRANTPIPITANNSQRRVSGVCPNGTQMKAITESGGVVCDGSVPPNEVSSDQIRIDSILQHHLSNCSVNGGVGGIVCDHSIVAADVNPDQVQLRVSGMCTSGFVRRINADGGVNCSTILPPGSVGATQLIDGAIGPVKIAANSLGHDQFTAEYQRGSPLGIPTLDATGKVPTAQLPLSQVSAVYACDGNNSACCPTINVTIASVCVTTNASYIWNGTVYFRLSSSALPSNLVQSVNGQVGIVSLTSDTVPQGSTNLYLLPSSVTASHIVNMTIQSYNLNSASITASKMAAASVSGGVGGTIADGTIVAADVNSAQVQLRVTGTCPGAGSTVASISAAGGVTCDATAANHIAITAANPHGTRLGQLADASVSSPTEGQYLQYIGGVWQNANPPNQITLLSQLDDVHIPHAKIPPLQDKDVLVFNKEEGRWDNVPNPIVGGIHAFVFCIWKVAEQPEVPETTPWCEYKEDGVFIVHFPVITVPPAADGGRRGRAEEGYTKYPVTLTMEDDGPQMPYIQRDSRQPTQFILRVVDSGARPTTGTVSVMVVNPFKTAF